MKMERSAAPPQLYPDLTPFYTPTTTPDPHPHPPPSVTPSAPPLHQSRPDLDLHVTPEEPEKDYMDEVSEADPGEVGGVAVEHLLELEPDYDTDDLPTGTLNLNDLNLNLTAQEKQLLHDKNIEVPEPPRKDQDFRAWMTWRLQANKMLAALILSRQAHPGQHVHHVRRKPLSPQHVQRVLQRARGEDKGRGRGAADRTSLPACPYVMYGIPRVNLTSATQP
ncbi:uncharacterized protein LOC143279909 [Babylonia areolata]|uniref:uncharacterized protein LOC143279909 n=1 Tax=Babylonia areolata TaxID=304850 RepID=UPI003FD1043A